MSEYASRADFLAPAKRRFKDVVLPVSKHKVRLRSWMDGEKEDYESAMMDRKSGGLKMDRVKQARRELIRRSVCDEHGELLLSLADMDALKSLDAADMAVLQEACQEFCGFKNGDIDNLVGNSESGPVSG